MTLLNPFMSFPAAGGGSFDPTTIPGCDLWLDASDESSITDSGGAASQWNDLSGNSNHATQGTGSAQPTTGTRTINSLNVLDFDGSDFLTLTTALAMGSSDDRTWFVVVEKDTSSTGMVLGVDGESSPFFGFNSNTPYGRNGGAVVTATAAVSTSSPVVYHVQQAGSGPIVGFNGGNEGTASEIRTGFSWNLIGKYNGGAPLDGVIGEVVSYNSALGTTDFDTALNGLANKWGITL